MCPIIVHIKQSACAVGTLELDDDNISGWEGDLLPVVSAQLGIDEGDSPRDSI